MSTNVRFIRKFTFAIIYDFKPWSDKNCVQLIKSKVLYNCKYKTKLFRFYKPILQFVHSVIEIPDIQQTIV